MREDKEKCYLSLDWDKVWEEYCSKMNIEKDTLAPSHVGTLESYVEHEINKVCEKLVEKNEEDIYKSVRYKYQYGANKIECIKECRNINRELSLKDAKDLVESWDT